MKPVLLSTLAFLVLAAPPMSTASKGLEDAGRPLPDLEYILEWTPGKPDLVTVTLYTKGNDDGQTYFTLCGTGDWGRGSRQCGSDVRNVAAFSVQGGALPVQPDGTGRWRVHHVEGDDLAFRYEVFQAQRAILPSASSYKRPIINRSAVSLVGHLGLVYPNHLSADTPRRIAVRWVGFEESGMQVASSWSMDQQGFEVSMPVKGFRNALFVAGAFRTRVEKIAGRPVHFLSAGNDRPFTDRRFAAIVTTLLEAEFRLFDDWDASSYLVCLIPVGQEGKRTIVGSANLTQVMALYLSPDVPLDDGSPISRKLKYIIAHELFHEWNGRMMQFPPSVHDLAWFREGFTAFFARRFLLRTGLYTLDDYIGDINAILHDHSQNPFANLSNDGITRWFWKDSDVRKLPYHRGELVALVVDRAIRKRWKGKKNLDDLMKTLFRQTRKGIPFLTSEQILDEIRVLTSRAFEQTIRGVVVEGNPVPVGPDALGPCYRMIPDSTEPRFQRSRVSEKDCHASL